MTTYYVYDGGTPVAEESFNGTSATFTALNGITADGWRARKQGSLVYQFAYDPQGSVQTRQTDTAFSSGLSAYDRSTFEGYGALRQANKGSTGASVGQHDPAGFGGQFGYYTDTETGLLCLTHRYYDPGTGKFINRDPIGYAGGANLYGFCAGNRVNRNDPSGWIIHIPSDKKGRDATNTALSFLMTNPTMKKVISSLRHSKTIYRITADNTEATDIVFDPSDVHIEPTIEWAPYEAALVEDSGGAIIGSISPALVLGHELLHAYHYDLNHDFYYDMRNADLTGTSDADYDNKEERRTISTERALAKFFHQTQRYNHRGQGSTVSGPLQRPK